MLSKSNSQKLRCTLSKHLMTRTFWCIHHRTHTLGWLISTRGYPSEVSLYFYILLLKQVREGKFRHCLFLDQHNPPWRYSWCREGILQFWRVPKDHRIAHGYLRRWWLGQTASQHFFNPWGFLLQDHTPFWPDFPEFFIHSSRPQLYYQALYDCSSLNYINS